MLSNLQSSGDDVVGLNLLRRLFGVPCSDPEHLACKEQHEEEKRQEEEFRRNEHEYLNRMEDEIAVIMRQRNRENGNR